MLELELDKAELKVIGGHRYYVFPVPPTHKNQDDRPIQYANEKDLKIYTGKGTNNSAKLHPDVLTPAGLLMTALIEYGDKIDDWSLKSAVIHSGYRPDDESQGRNYLRIIKQYISRNPGIFGTLTFPESLEKDAQGVLGRPDDPRRKAFKKKVAESPGWSAELAKKLFELVDNAYAPRGSNPHATGFVFDVDFWVYCNGVENKKDKKTCAAGGEHNVGADTRFNRDALRSAAGMWLNKYAMQFGFDSYNTDKEIWHMEYRKWK